MLTLAQQKMQDLESHNTLDQGQFEKLFKSHFTHLCNYAGQFVQDREAAKDITQKVFISLWENRRKIDPSKSVISYLFRSVKNRSLNYIRDHKKFRSSILDLECNDFDLSFEHDYLALEELESKISKALEKLPEKCRLVFEMSRFQNMKYQDIAENLSISQKTVEAHMTKALKLLRENLKEYFLIFLLLYNWYDKF